MPSPRIRLTGELIRYIALFEGVTGATASDCLIDENFRRLIFVTKPGDIGLAIGKGGKNVDMLKKMTGRPIEIVEYADTLEGLVRNALAPARIKDIRVTERPDKKTVVVEVEQRDKALAIGKNGRTIDKTRTLAKRYFQVDYIQIS